MLKKLRLKFIAINMTIVTAMLCLIFCMLYLTTRSNLERESIQMMNTIALNPQTISPPDKQLEDIRLPYFSVMVNHAGELVDTGGGFFDLSDDELLQDIMTLTYDSHTESGILEEYNLRFLRTETVRGLCYVFADMTSEKVMLRHMLRNFLLVGLLAFMVFLGISVLLARWAVKPVETAWSQQKKFVADASHELKTPLTVILNDAEMLGAPDCSEAERMQLSAGILTMSGQMRELVESLLELARIDNGSVRESMQPLCFSDIVRDASMIFEPIFFEKGLPFSYHVDSSLELTGNASHLKQIVDIYLDNASKYASPGGKTLLILRDIKGKKCQLKVSNQGPPISDHDIINLFKRFYRADQARSRCSSYGLGLSIAESIAEEHHGKVWAESKDGYNSFYLELPLK